MEHNFLKPSCKNLAGKTLFYIFEIASLVIFVIQFILAIIVGAHFGFLNFVEAFCSGIINLLLIFGLGKIIDLLYVGKDSNAQEKKQEEKN